MRELSAGILLALIILLQSAIGTISFNILKAFLSPPTPRLTRIRDISPREIREKNPFAVSDFLGLVKQHNYPAEEHNVTTTDGYNLILHRIPDSPYSPPAKRKPIVLIQHGIWASSDSWVLIGPGKDLAFLLADAGYDVWIGNFRGNTYSRSHVVLRPDDPAFWEFSFHEMAYYDLPAMIDHILEETGQKSLTYVGHSMATTCSYILLSTKPEYNKRLRLVVSLAPIAYWTHKFDGIKKMIVDHGELIETILRSKRIFELLPQSSLNMQLITALCKDRSATQPLCLHAVLVISGLDYSQFNTSLIPYLAGYFPAGTSLKTVTHYYQNIIKAKFRHYDYGYIGNFAHYEQKEPPDYDLSKVTAPVVLLYGQGDAVSQEENVKELTKRLPNVVKSEALSHKAFSHLDFVWANDAKRLLYDDVIELIHRFK